MDNVTHALAGLLVAELVSSREERRTGERPPWRGLACLTSMVAQNLPDSDFVLVQLTGGTLGYLVQHRGYTHTLLAVLPLALLLLAPIALWLRVRGRHIGRRGWAHLIGLAIVGGVFHIAMDGTNDYGVHPFWPLDPRWFYGDSIFIIEPLLWACAIPSLIFVAETRVARIVMGALLGAVVVLSAVVREMVRPATPAVIVAVAVIVALVALRLPRSHRATLGAGAWAAVTLSFVVASGSVARQVRAVFAARQPEAVLLDIVITPAPADLFCWRALTVSTTSRSYALGVYAVSLWPSLVEPEDCPRAEPQSTTAPLSTVAPEPRSPGVRELRRLTLSLAALQDVRARCDVDTFLRWARAPFWLTRTRELVMGDLRYDREPGLGFAEVALPLTAPERCPPRVPTWAPPRDDVP